MSATNGPGSLAMENHDDLASRLAAVCDRHGLDYRRRAEIGQTPYRNPFKADLLLTGLADYPAGLAVIGRWQDGSGSADQKLPFLLLTINRCRTSSVIVLDGEGWTEGVWQFMRNRPAGGYLVATVTFDQFAAMVAQLGRAA